MTVEAEAEVMIRRRNEMVDLDSVDRSAGSTFWAVNNDQGEAVPCMDAPHSRYGLCISKLQAQISIIVHVLLLLYMVMVCLYG